MKIKAMDLIVQKVDPGGHSELVSHSQMLLLGHHFLCSHVSIERFLEDDREHEVRSRTIYAIECFEGVNFYD